MDLKAVCECNGECDTFFSFKEYRSLKDEIDVGKYIILKTCPSLELSHVVLNESENCYLVKFIQETE